MTDHSDLIERLRSHVRDRGGMSRDAETGEIVLPNGAWAMMLAAADALSSQSLSLSEARALAEAQQNGNRFANSQWTKCVLRLQKSEEDRARLLKQREERAAERDALVAAGEELVTALGRYGFPMSDEAWRNTGDDAPVNSQASVEARALHRAAAAYLRAISGGFDGGK